MRSEKERGEKGSVGRGVHQRMWPAIIPLESGTRVQIGHPASQFYWSLADLIH